MFSTFKQRILLGIYIFIILSIPVGAYLASQSQTYKSSAQEAKPKVSKKTILPTPYPATDSAKQLLSLAEESTNTSPATPGESEPTPGVSSPTIATSFGPTLSLTVTLEGRPKNNQATKLFIGILEGTLTSNPKFLLSFSVDLPASGEFSNLSLAGLTAGTQYTALLKGSAQIATSSAFVMTPTTTILNEGQPINMPTGDLNEDNTINAADYSIVQKLLGITSKSAGWNENADFNKDGIINTFDLALLTKNMGKAGASGTWTSPLPKVATPSGNLATQQQSGIGGYWMWIPK